MHTDRLGALFSLDVMMLVTAPIDIFLFTSLYVALKRVNESFALIALVLGLMAIALLSSVLMLRSKSFSKATAYIGIANSIFALGIIIPVFVIQAICGLGATVVGTLWFVLLGRGFFRLGKEIG